MPLVLFGAKWAAVKYFSWIEKKEDNKTAMMLFIMMLAALGAELIHLEGIVGAFVVGLAVNEVIKGGKVKAKLDTLGNTLFIPMFFIILGAMIEPASFVSMNGNDYIFAVLLVFLLIGAKYAAAWISSKFLNYSSSDSALMWSLSIPQVAATLAAALVAFHTYDDAGNPLISKMVFDSVLILMAVTVTAGPILTEIYLKRENDKDHD
jgi:Kef-type K+ transport system membrane component KefB